MAVVDPYAPCPCGSGEKFKWCCQKVEAFAERSQRLYDNGQVDAALAAIDEGLRKEPNNSWLLVRKAGILVVEERPEEALPFLQKVVERQPAHVGAQNMLIRTLIDTDGPIAAAAQLQHALKNCQADHRSRLAMAVRIVGVAFSEYGLYSAALKHLDLSIELEPEGEGANVSRSTITMIERNPMIAPWFKEFRTLEPAPDELPVAIREQWNEALAWANQGWWISASAAFDLLGNEGPAASGALNLALTRLWLGDAAGAAEALKRYVARQGSTAKAVDMEAMRQSISAPAEDELVELVQLIWPLKNRPALVTALGAAKDVVAQGRMPLNPEDENSPVADAFALLDRPLPEPGVAPAGGELPKVEARILVGQEIVALGVHDDENLSTLSDRFTALAGPAIPPAHPRTKVLDKESRMAMLFGTEWVLPQGLDREVVKNLRQQNRAHVLHHIWPRTPMFYLDGLTPLQAAQAGNTVGLRAAVFKMELISTERAEASMFAELRKLLGIESEPELDAATVVIERAPLSRLHLIPADRLDDDRLVALYQRARKFGQARAELRAVRALVERPSLLAARLEIDEVFSTLALEALNRDDRETALSWIKRGREMDPGTPGGRLAAAWDCLEIQLKMHLDPPEHWVAELAAVLDRYRANQEANLYVIDFLISAGLIEVVPDPQQGGRILLDPRRLQTFLKAYGPRVATAAGELGVSATPGGIWTPSGAGGGTAGGAIWTPGSTPGPAAPGGEKPRLIIPGR